MSGGGEIGVAIVSRDRRDSLLRTLAELTALPERPPIVVVDNRSADDSAAAVADRFPAVELIRARRNLGAGGRNLAARQLDCSLVAFADDDSWWEPGALGRAAACFRRSPSLGLLAARILVGEKRRLDPVCKEMAAGPAPPQLPGPRIDGFVACGAVVRREAFLAAGGFCERFLIGGEERLLALDLRAAGWELCYSPAVTAIHWPGDGGRDDRRWLRCRNDLWTSWLREPAPVALRRTAALALEAPWRRSSRRALASAARGLGWVLAERRRTPTSPQTTTPTRRTTR